MTVVGARPQFIKAAPVLNALRPRHELVLIHTGQHHDTAMSGVFFDELGLQVPDHHLGIHSLAHGAMVGRMLEEIERVLLDRRPDLVLVFGDTNSTLAGALAAVKLHIPVAHVEAGLRSFNRAMPEEINRVLTDHLSALLFCPSAIAERNLAAEGVTKGVHVVGDVMEDALHAAASRARERSMVLEELGLSPRSYALATIHRAENTDDPRRLSAILEGLGGLGITVALPLHPRTRGAIASAGLHVPNVVRITEPRSYLDMVRLEADAVAILTDSGGVQKEAYWLGVPCITVRDQTEWTETVDAGWNRLAAADPAAIIAAFRSAGRPAERPALFGAPGAAARVAALLEAWGSA